MTKYELLDSKIMSKIDAHPMPFSSLYVMDVAKNAAASQRMRISQNLSVFSIAGFRRYVNREKFAVHPKKGWVRA